ncbi:hypothetical protein UPYG_G00091170 [Umbra pygmaea]|uniref:Circadian-associated transcriptional repressor-like n=1 Tax=Umbra pygmaea TaxID=75934 RepID=A0ABD0Y541_UMBPY
MSTSDSDYSIDYLASDSEDNDSAVGLSPGGPAADSSRTQPPSSLPPPSSSSIDSPINSDCSNDGVLRLNRGSTSEDTRRLTTDSGDSGLSRDGEDAVGPAPQLNRGSIDGCDGSPPAPTDKDQYAPEYRHDVFSPRQQRHSWALWNSTASSHAWGSRDVSASGKPCEGRKRVHSSSGWLNGDHMDLETPKLEETAKDPMFAQKCLELQCYLRPLASILRGLRSGRYSERLSGFQESVAMDRIQRIMGVLQNPNMGERYVTVILKMEEMLRSWFPHVRPCRESHPEKHADSQEDHIPPAKKHKLSQTSVHPPPPACPIESVHYSALRPTHAPLSGSYTTHPKLPQNTPVCSSKPDTETAQQETPVRGMVSSACSLGSLHDHAAQPREQTQDDAVSSSTDPHGCPRDLPTSPPRARPRANRRGPPSGKISSPCLERLLQSKESIITPRNRGGDGSSGNSWL